MPQPRQPASTAASNYPDTATTAAVATAAAPTVAASTIPAIAAVGAPVITARAAAFITNALVNALEAFAQKREADSVVFFSRMVRERYPTFDAQRLRDLIAK